MKSPNPAAVDSFIFFPSHAFLVFSSHIACQCAGGNRLTDGEDSRLVCGMHIIWFSVLYAVNWFLGKSLKALYREYFLLLDREYDPVYALVSSLSGQAFGFSCFYLSRIRIS
jgi:hypothetical protein